MKIELPAKKDLVITNDEDPLEFYYLPLAGSFYKKRLVDILLLLGNDNYDKLLEIGFGSGLFFLELAKRTKALYGLEIHDRIDEVRNSLARYNIKADLRKGDILQLPFENGFFDAVVSVSTLEHIKDLEKASQEILRVLKPRGLAVLGFPVRSIVTDAIFKIFGRDPRRIHPSSDKDILRVFGRKMIFEEIKYIPNFSPKFFKMYISARFKKR